MTRAVILRGVVIGIRNVGIFLFAPVALVLCLGLDLFRHLSERGK